MEKTSSPGRVEASCRGGGVGWHRAGGGGVQFGWQGRMHSWWRGTYRCRRESHSDRRAGAHALHYCFHVRLPSGGQRQGGGAHCEGGAGSAQPQAPRRHLRHHGIPTGTNHKAMGSRVASLPSPPCPTIATPIIHGYLAALACSTAARSVLSARGELVKYLTHEQVPDPVS